MISTNIFKMEDNKLIFWTGAPGSKWSATAWCLSKTKKLDIDISDRASHRGYEHSNFPGTRHVGSYFGPGFEFGNKFHNINTLTKNEIKDEINKAFSNNKYPEKYKIIRCHQFVYNLDWIRDTFPTSKIVIVYRKPEMAFNGMLSIGSIAEIKYPNYKEYYKNDKILEEKINEECYLASKWIFDNDMDVNVACYNHFKQRWGLTFKSEEDQVAKYIRSLEGFFRKNLDPYEKIRYDTIIAYHNFQNNA